MLLRRQWVIAVLVVTGMIGPVLAIAAASTGASSIRIGASTPGKTELQREAADDPLPGAMYVLGFSLIGFALVARRRKPASDCD